MNMRTPTPPTNRPSLSLRSMRSNDSSECVVKPTDEKDKAEQQQAQHAAIVSLVLSKATRLRKDSKGRRHRDLHGKLLDDAVEALTSFQDVEWPPRGGLGASCDLPEWMSPERSVPSLDEMEGLSSPASPRLSVESDAGRKDDEDEEEDDEDEYETESDEEDQDDDDEEEDDDDDDEGRTTNMSVAAKLTTDDMSMRALGESELADAIVKKARSPVAIPAVNLKIGEEKQSEELMHPSVILSLEAFCFVMRSTSKTPKMCELSLDCVTLLVTNGYVSGVAGMSEDGSHKEKGEKGPSRSSDAGDPPQSILDYLIESVSKCSESSSEVVHTAMTKALLSLMTSSKCGVHEAALLVSVRSTFHVYLVSKSANAKELSKATLLDMLKVVFNRMEAYDAIAKSTNRSAGGKAARQHNGTLTPGRRKKTESSGDADADGGEDEKKPSTNSSPESLSVFASQYHTDGYLLFRALCKLSAKALPEEDKYSQNAKILQPFTVGPVVDPLALNSKVLSLELILAIFEHCGDAFRTGDKFIYAVQNYLCVSLLKNCMSVHMEVAFLSLKIFLAVVYNFKSHLKSEIEVFVANIFLRVLESPNSSFDQKALVLKALRALCSDPLILTQLFLNYDCDFDAVDLYKNIVHNLTRVSGKSRSAVATLTKKDASEEMALCQAGLEVLVVILRAFLKVLDLPGGDDKIDDSISPLRSSLHLDIGLAVTPDNSPKSKSVVENGEASDSDDLSIYAQEVKEHAAQRKEGLANKIVDAFDRKRSVQQNFETGVVKFTLSLKTGLLYFIENGFVELDAREVALFLHRQKDRLDKTQIGETLGKEPEYSFVKDKGIDPEKGGEGFFVRILHHYVYALDFAEQEFDDAIRFFLSGFRLPGEAQKIDRIMEKFAERYTRQNEDVFPSADTAFILAFSVIMLNTDLHNPSIKPEKRMTLESFVRNNRGISVDGGDLPEEYLEGIYRRIQEKPFTLKEDDDARAKERQTTMQDTFFVFESRNFFGASAEDRKREKFRKEREEMMAASEQLFRKHPHKKQDKGSSASKQKSNHSQLAESVSPTDIVKPMFDVTWGPLIGTLSQILETSDDQNTINLCLNGFVYSVRIASHSNMSLARDTFVNALTKFTTLGSIKEMKYKNIESIQTLLSIAIIDGEFLGESWGPVLQCISHLARLQLFASGVDEDDRFLRAESEEEVAQDNLAFFRQPSKDELARATESSNAQAVLAAVNEILIDKVYSSTVNLSARSMAHFIEQLVHVSAAEISGNLKKGIGVAGVSSSQQRLQNGAGAGGKALRGSSSGCGPRIFSLQKLVEVADYNMDARPRIAWTQMWELMAKHFATIGCHENGMVSMFAIDALRQLSFKFLQKPELYDFNFQRVFLRPFLQIMENESCREDIRELILRCVDNMIRTLSHNLRSGWKIFFSIIVHSANDPSEKICTLGLAILQRLLDEHLDELCGRYCVDEYIEGHLTGEESPNEMTSLQRRIRNASAEDFVGLCHASLSFVQTEEADRPLPIGLSMRALCHTACYADLIAEKKVLPPVSSQSTDPHGFGYTYDDLNDGEAEEMVLWRPILDGLAAGICSTERSNSGGVGCLVQRGSVMTLRSILLRHGSLFSVSQWAVILRQVIFPAIQNAAEYDASPVVCITSESPSVSSVDFLAEPLPLPPAADDEGLMKFATKAQNEESAPSRPLGPAELLVEASFTDLRHGGDGDLSRAHGLSKKSWTKKSPHEQPFPDSWVATTAPIALGMVTDIISEFALAFGSEGRELLWPLVLGQYQLWIIGPPIVDPHVDDSDDVSVLDEDYFDPLWRPCEALARLGCRELDRITKVLASAFPSMDEGNAFAWCATLCSNLASTLSQNVSLEAAIHQELLDFNFASDQPTKASTSTEEEIIGLITPYGRGRVVKRRKDRHGGNGNSCAIPIWEVVLEWGATMYGPDSIYEEGNGGTPEDKNERGVHWDSGSSTDNGNDSDEVTPRLVESNVNESNLLSRDNFLIRFVPAIKIRCVVAHVLQQNLLGSLNTFVNLIGEGEVSNLLASLDLSRKMACKASLDDDVSRAFREWGGGGDETEEMLRGVGGSNRGQQQLRGGSEMFFLTQQAGASKVIIHLLSQLYCDEEDSFSRRNWDCVSFAEPILMERAHDVLIHFLESEKKDGHLVDPNVWQKPCESGGNVALYCTSFAGVVVSVLNTVLKFRPDQFSRQQQDVYPLLCSLVKVQSNEIRSLVSDILSQQVAPLLGIHMDKQYD